MNIICGPVKVRALKTPKASVFCAIMMLAPPKGNAALETGTAALASNSRLFYKVTKVRQKLNID